MSTAPGIIRACTLTTYEMDHMNRVYSPEGIAPTIHTCGGGNTEPKILVETAPPPGGNLTPRLYRRRVPHDPLHIRHGRTVPDTMGESGERPHQGGARMRIQNATRRGWLEAEPGDGIVLNLLGRARGRVQKNKSPTLHTGGGTPQGWQ